MVAYGCSIWCVFLKRIRPLRRFMGFVGRKGAGWLAQSAEGGHSAKSRVHAKSRKNLRAPGAKRTPENGMAGQSIFGLVHLVLCPMRSAVSVDSFLSPK